MKSTFKVLFYLKKGSEKKNGEVMIMARITIDGKLCQFSTKQSILPDSWNIAAGKAKGKDAGKINALLDDIKVDEVYSTSTPRGRIFDRNYNLLVDNVGVKTIYYKKEKGITTKEEIELAYKVADIIDLDLNKLSDNMLRNFWVINNKEDANKKITDGEWKKYKEKKKNCGKRYGQKREESVK